MKRKIISHEFRISIEEKRLLPTHAPDTQFSLLQSVTLAHFPPTLLAINLISNV